MATTTLGTFLNEIRQLECDHYTIDQTKERLRSTKKPEPKMKYISGISKYDAEKVKYWDVGEGLLFLPEKA